MDVLIDGPGRLFYIADGLVVIGEVVVRHPVHRIQLDDLPELLEGFLEVPAARVQTPQEEPIGGVLGVRVGTELLMN
jgi:hypothetical protein